LNTWSIKAARTGTGDISQPGLPAGLRGSGPSDGTPAEARIEFLRALHAGNRKAAVACMARDACFVTPDATVIRGRPDIAAILGQLTATGMELDAEPLCSALIAGNTAVSPERWSVTSAGEGAERLVQTFASRSIMIRAEGTWRFLILAPWGWG
jgi:ketosteroid isomerase-like protein